MSQIEQTYEIKAPVIKVWQAVTDAETAEKWGTAPAKVDPKEGQKTIADYRIGGEQLFFPNAK